MLLNKAIRMKKIIIVLLSTVFVSFHCVSTGRSAAKQPGSVERGTTVRSDDTEAITPWTKPVVGEEYFIAHVKDLEKHDVGRLDTLDFTKLRFSYAAHIKKLSRWPDKRMRPVSERYNAAQDKGDNRLAARLLDSMITLDPLNIEFHKYRSDFLYTLKDPDTFNFDMAKRLCGSITESGSGESAKSPFHVAQGGEIDGFLKANQITVSKDTVVTIGKSEYTVVDAVGEDKKPFKIYFKNEGSQPVEESAPAGTYRENSDESGGN
jgi:hypothetical protein